MKERAAGSEPKTETTAMPSKGGFLYDDEPVIKQTRNQVKA
ncbi:hypothetical protein NEIELOOT_01551 [Neisseria elongata subsp. glycolytica ATCC 29315]|uniref:Uncharacterized protein n=1 Tax=Neisseria elongata subsp. glycolytica ATCC 29315 TaxID=546263 RepID=D4DR58_NEIEG|nr:hypothetical protein NEIELOOT_01551 [Neisseria elongata subsp. glycolytica ATCC 29315]